MDSLRLLKESRSLRPDRLPKSLPEEGEEVNQMPLTGLTGLGTLQTLQEDTPELTAEEVHGSSANPYHGQVGEQATPTSSASLAVPGSGSAWATPVDGLVDDTYSFPLLTAGKLADDPTSERAPWTHAAPWPKDPIGDGSVGPDNTIRQLNANAAIHAIDVGGKRNINILTMDPLQDDWREIWQVDPNHTDLAEVPAQMKSGAAPGGRGHTDRTQSNAHQNQYGFDSRHMHRRYAAGSIPGNYMWMNPGGRMLVKSMAGPARPPIGEGSQFTGNDLGQAFSVDGAILQAAPVQYVAQPSPYVAPGYTSDQMEAPMVGIGGDF